jgi:hypothetical protein
MRDGGWTILPAAVCWAAIGAAMAADVAVHDGVASAAEGATVSPLAAGFPIGPLAGSGNGQTVYGIDESRRAVVAFDPRDPERRRDAIAPAGSGVPAPVAVGCLPGDLLAVVVRAGEEWSLRTFRVAPGRPADPAAPVQTVRIGRAAGVTASAGIAVSQSRDWLAIGGLPEPLPPVVRAVFAGAGVRPLSADECPSVPADRRVVAVAVSPADELVLVDAPAQGAGPVAIAFHNAAGREILRLDTGLANVRGAAFGRGDGTLWLIADEATLLDQAAGLWRIDSEFRERRQAARAVCVARLPAPRGVACVSDRSVVVAQGGAKPCLVRVDPAPARRADHQDHHDSEEHPTR